MINIRLLYLCLYCFVSLILFSFVFSCYHLYGEIKLCFLIIHKFIIDRSNSHRSSSSLADHRHRCH